MFFPSPTPNWHLFDLGRAEPIKSQMTCLGHTTTFNVASSLKCKFPYPTPPRNASVQGHMDSGKSSKSCALTHQQMHQLLGMWISWWRCTFLTGLNGIERSGSGTHQSSYVYASYTCLEKGAMQCHMPSNQFFFFHHSHNFKSCCIEEFLLWIISLDLCVVVVTWMTLQFQWVWSICWILL